MEAPIFQSIVHTFRKIVARMRWYTVSMNTYREYRSYKKPSWAPPPWIFSPVWTVLYILILISFGAVFYEAAINVLPWAVALPFALNLVFNFAFTWLQFGLKKNMLATSDVLLVWVTLVWGMTAVYPYAHWIAYMNIPYLLWVSFASVLQITVTFLNRKV